MDKASINYGTRFAFGMGGYAMLLVVGIIVVQGIPDSPWRYLVMALPVPALIWVVVSVGLYLRDADELQAKILLESLGIGFAGGSLITFTWGLMQAVGAPEVNWMLVFPVYAACWLIGRLVAGRRYA